MQKLRDLDSVGSLTNKHTEPEESGLFPGRRARFFFLVLVWFSGTCFFRSTAAVCFPAALENR